MNKQKMFLPFQADIYIHMCGTCSTHHWIGPGPQAIRVGGRGNPRVLNNLQCIGWKPPPVCVTLQDIFQTAPNDALSPRLNTFTWP